MSVYSAPNFKKLLKPIYNLTRKGRQFIWGEEQEKAFDEIKHRLQRAPVLHLPDRHGRFLLYSDTSKFATGSMLYQIQNGQPRLIAYASKRMPEAAKNYSITELEMCRLAMNITTFSHLLKKVDFDAVVDHLAITHIMRSKAEPATTRIKRLIELLSPYSFNLYYIKGKDMVLSDFLSRQKTDDSNPYEIIPISFTPRSQVDNHFYQIDNEIDQPKSDEYLVQTRSQLKSSGIKIPEIHGANKGLNPHVKPRKQRPLPSLPTHSLPPTSLVHRVDKGPPTHTIPKPRIGQGRARLRRKVKTNQPIPLPQQTPAQPITTHVPKKALPLPEPIIQSQVNVCPQQHIPILAIPEICVDKIIVLYHTSLFAGHQGVVKTYLTMKDKFFIPNLMHYLRSFIKERHRCQLFRPDKPPTRQLQPQIYLNYRPLSKLSMDLKVMPRSLKGHKFILCIIDKMTNYLITVPIHHSRSEEVGEALIEHVISKFCAPNCIIMDQDSTFMSTLMNYLFRKLNIKIMTVALYNHQSLQAEHGIKSLSRILTKLLSGQGQMWHKFLPLATFAHNTFNSPNLANHSPYELVSGRKPKLLLDLEMDLDVKVSGTYREYLLQLRKRLGYLHKLLQDFWMKRPALINKDREDFQYNHGHLVYIISPITSQLRIASRKVSIKYVGPLAVYKIVDPHNYLLITLDGKIIKRLI